MTAPRKTGWILLETITKDTDDEDIWCYFETEGRMIVSQMDRKTGHRLSYTFIDGQMHEQAGSMSRKLASYAPAHLKRSSNRRTTLPRDTVSLSDFARWRSGKWRTPGKRPGYTIEGALGISEEEEPFFSLASLKTEPLTLPRRISHIS
ncbi:MAG: hypothetical protein ACLR8P_16490 [Clostridium fessum]